jgi:hypothetical protein
MIGPTGEEIMNPTTQTGLDDSLDYLDEMGVVGGAKIKKFIDSLSSKKKEQEILTVIVRAEHPGYFWQSGWKRAARTWMLCKLVSGDHLGNGFWDQPNGGVINGWVMSLNNKYEPQLQSEIRTMLAFGGPFNQLETFQKDPSRTRWDKGSFTDPKNHKSTKFCYIVYALTGSVGMKNITAESNPRSDYLKKTLTGYLDEASSSWNFRCAEYYLKNPSVMHSELLSCSIVSDEHPKTYRDSPFGFVLSVPKENLCFASPSDMALSNADGRTDSLQGMSQLAKLATVSRSLEPIVGMYQQKLDSPSEILTKAKSKGGHTELAVVGSISGLLVVPVAIFIKVTSGGALWPTFVTEAVQFGLKTHILNCAATHSIPIVALVDDSKGGSDESFSTWFPNGKI